jgi:hypothetical protein
LNGAPRRAAPFKINTSANQIATKISADENGRVPTGCAMLASAQGTIILEGH